MNPPTPDRVQFSLADLLLLTLLAALHIAVLLAIAPREPGDSIAALVAAGVGIALTATAAFVAYRYFILPRVDSVMQRFAIVITVEFCCAVALVSLLGIIASVLVVIVSMPIFLPILAVVAGVVVAIERWPRRGPDR